MITDALQQLSSAQAVTASAVSTNTMDLGANRDMAPGSDVYAVFSVDAAPTAAGLATVQFQLISSASANLSSPTVLSEMDPIAIADLTLARKPITLNLNAAALLAQPIGQRYLGAQYTIGTGPLTAGAFSCVLTDTDVSVNKYYPSGFSVY